jgi:hypothetical protein
MFAVNCASCACRCDSCRGFCEGTVLRREELCERALWDIFSGRVRVVVEDGRAGWVAGLLGCVSVFCCGGKGGEQARRGRDSRGERALAGGALPPELPRLFASPSAAVPLACLSSALNFALRPCTVLH